MSRPRTLLALSVSLLLVLGMLGGQGCAPKTNIPPVANAGPDQTVVVGTLVQLDGRKSSDVDGDTLSYRWSFTSTPAGSLATFDDPTAITPTFAVDRPGMYTVQLIVNDGTVDSPPDTVVISIKNSHPVADAGPDQTVAVGESVQLDGRASHDVDADPLSYQWSLTVRPPSSAATLSAPTQVAPTFPADQPGAYVAQLIVNDGQLDSTPATTTITAGVPPQISLNLADGALLNTATLLLTITYQDAGSGIDLTTLRVTLDGVDVTARFAIMATQATYQATLADGVHQLTVTLRNLAGLSAQASAQFTIDTVPPPPIPQASLTVGPVTNGQVTITGAPSSTEGGTLVTLVNPRTGLKVQVRATAAGGFTAVLEAQQGDGVTLTSTDAAGNTSAPTVVPVGVPPDPALVAPPLDGSVATTVWAATTFLYTSPSPIQSGVPPDTIAPQRVAVLRGRVLDRTAAPLAGVQVTIFQHPEFGSTLSRADGMFDLAVNGGGLLTVQYGKADFLPAQRQVQVPWQDYVWAPDVVLIPRAAEVTAIDLSAGTMQVARGRLVTDTRGTRQATLLFAPGTQATIRLPDGSTQPLTTLHVRATEFSVGAHGPQAMPGTLPSTVGYTHAADFSVDEAVAAGAVSVAFNPPVVLYQENFLALPVGLGVPLGAYEQQQNLWIPHHDGRIVQILSTSAGVARVDVDGSGQPASAADLASLGITEPELREVGRLYPPGQEVWRLVLPHFTAWDT